MMFARELFVLDRDEPDHHRVAQRAQTHRMVLEDNIQFVAYHDILYFCRYQDGTVVRYAYGTCNNCRLFHTCPDLASPRRLFSLMDTVWSGTYISLDYAVDLLDCESGDRHIPVCIAVVVSYKNPSYKS
jgi:hypothetical protein